MDDVPQGSSKQQPPPNVPQPKLDTSLESLVDGSSVEEDEVRLQVHVAPSATFEDIDFSYHVACTADVPILPFDVANTRFAGELLTCSLKLE